MMTCLYLHFHMYFPNIHIQIICFDLVFCLSNRCVHCCSLALQVGEEALGNCCCWGGPRHQSHGLQSRVRISLLTKTAVFDLPCMLSLPLPGRLGLFWAAGLQAERAPWWGWPHPHPGTAAGASSAPCPPKNRFLGKLFVHTQTVNQCSTLLSCRRFVLSGKCLSTRFVFRC